MPRKLKLKKYSCPFENCNGKIETLVPYKNQVIKEKGYWDSSVQCPACKQLHFKKVYPSGKVEALRIFG